MKRVILVMILTTAAFAVAAPPSPSEWLTGTLDEIAAHRGYYEYTILSPEWGGQCGFLGQSARKLRVREGKIRYAVPSGLKYIFIRDRSGKVQRLRLMKQWMMPPPVVIRPPAASR